MDSLQLSKLHPVFDDLQALYGEPGFPAVYGAGCIHNPKFCFVFMNPTARNVSTSPGWGGIRAPWIGTKPTWRLFYDLGFLDRILFEKIYACTPQSWTVDLAEEIYSSLALQGIFVTNLAKCTQSDAKELGNSVFESYLPSFLSEISLLNPEKIITFGNQVSSIILGKKITVSSYLADEREELQISGNSYSVFPCYYPVGNGYFNVDKAKKRIHVLSSLS